MTSPNPRDLIRRLTENLDHLHCYYNVPDQSALISKARDYLDQSVPEEPTDEELLKLAGEWDSGYESIEFEFIAEYAKEVLQRWGAS